jgi:hypothetical protein
VKILGEEKNIYIARVFYIIYIDLVEIREFSVTQGILSHQFHQFVIVVIGIKNIYLFLIVNANVETGRKQKRGYRKSCSLCGKAEEAKRII